MNVGQEEQDLSQNLDSTDDSRYSKGSSGKSGKTMGAHPKRLLYQSAKTMIVQEHLDGTKEENKGSSSDHPKRKSEEKS